MCVDLKSLTLCTRYNVYSQITSDNVNSGSYDGNGQYNPTDIIQSGAVLIASLMPYVDWTDITPGLCDSVANFFESTFTSQGTTVWLRFAHEMNYYSDVGVYPGGSKLSNPIKAHLLFWIRILMFLRKLRGVPHCLDNHVQCD